MHALLRLDLRLPVHALDKLSQRLLVGGQEVAVAKSTRSHIYVAAEAARFLRSTVMGVGERNTKAKVVVYKRRRDEYGWVEK